MNFEPKFGSHKNLVTFADLAMKSKAQAAKALTVKPKGRPGRKPKKLDRKKVSARISLEQSEIEDTPCLLALQASRDTDMLDEESSAIIEEAPVMKQESDCVESTLAVTENKDSEDEEEA